MMMMETPPVWFLLHYPGPGPAVGRRGGVLWTLEVESSCDPLVPTVTGSRSGSKNRVCCFVLLVPTPLSGKARRGQACGTKVNPTLGTVQGGIGTAQGGPRPDRDQGSTVTVTFFFAVKAGSSSSHELSGWAPPFVCLTNQTHQTERLVWRSHRWRSIHPSMPLLAEGVCCTADCLHAPVRPRA